MVIIPLPLTLISPLSSSWKQLKSCRTSRVAADRWIFSAAHRQVSTCQLTGCTTQTRSNIPCCFISSPLAAGQRISSPSKTMMLHGVEQGKVEVNCSFKSLQLVMNSQIKHSSRLLLLELSRKQEVDPPS